MSARSITIGLSAASCAISAVTFSRTGDWALCWASGVCAGLMMAAAIYFAVAPRLTTEGKAEEKAE